VDLSGETRKCGVMLVPKNTAVKDRIVHSAGNLFARQGYHGTSTREIANLAVVSENTIFRHFEHKEDIFWVALSTHLATVNLSQDILEGIAQCDSPEMVLPKLLKVLDETARAKPELLRLIAVAFIELRVKATGFFQEHFSRALSAINLYLNVNIENGKIRGSESLMLISAMIGAVFIYPGIYSLIDGNKPSYSSSLEAERAYAKFWSDLLVPRMAACPRQIGQRLVDHSDGAREIKDAVDS
jgi:AcrR family transcriptional regulator